MAAADIDPDSGYEIYTEIFEWLKEGDRARFVTMGELYREWRDSAGPQPESLDPEREETEYDPMAVPSFEHADGHGVAGRVDGHGR